VSAYRLSLAQILAGEGQNQLAGAQDAPNGGPREAARCGKLVFRLHKPPQK